MPDPSCDLLSHCLRYVAGVVQKDLRTDEELLACFVESRDEVAFTAIVGRYAALVWASCRRVLGTTPDAEDAFQATFVTLAKKANSIRKNSLPFWLNRVSTRVALQHRRSALRRMRREGLSAAAPPRESAEVGPDEIEAVREELLAMPERLRVPLVLYYLQGQTQAAIGQVLGVTDRAVAKRLEKALRELRSRLASRRMVTTVTAVVAILSRADFTLAKVPAGLIGRTIAASLREASAAVGLAATGSWWLSRGAVVIALAAGCALAGALAIHSSPRSGYSQSNPVHRQPELPLPLQQDASEVLTGRVVDEFEQPLAGARLAVFVRPPVQRGAGRRDEILAEGETTAEGHFCIPLNLDRSRWVGGEPLWLVASDDGGRRRVVTSVAAGERQSRGPLDVRLVARAFSGKVVGPGGEPVAGAVVNVARFGGATFDQPISTAPPFAKEYWPEPTITGVDGRFTIPGIDPASELRLAIAHRSGPGRALNLTPAELAGDVTISLEAVRAIRGRVIADDSGKPMAGALIDIAIPSGNSTLPVRRRAFRTDADGQFSATMIVADQWILNASVGGSGPYLAVTHPLNLPAGNDPVEVEIRLPRGRWISGRVVEKESRKPVALARIRWWPRAPYPAGVPAPATPSTATDADGRYALLIPADGGVLTVTAPESDFAAELMPKGVGAGVFGNRPHAIHAVVSLDRGEQPPDVTTVERGISIHGIALKPDQTPVVDGAAMCHHFLGGRDFQSPRAVAVRNGRFVIPGCRVGQSYGVAIYDHERKLGAFVRLTCRGAPAESKIASITLAPTQTAEVVVRGPRDLPEAGSTVILELGLPPDPDSDGEVTRDPAAVNWHPLVVRTADATGVATLPGVIRGQQFRATAVARKVFGTAPVATDPLDTHSHSTIALPAGARANP